MSTEDFKAIIERTIAEKDKLRKKLEDEQRKSKEAIARLKAELRDCKRTIKKLNQLAKQYSDRVYDAYMFIDETREGEE